MSELICKKVIENLSNRELFSPMDFGKLKSIFSPLINEIMLNDPSIVTIAGTNGKGETAYHFEKLALSSTKKTIKTAMWTSLMWNVLQSASGLMGKIKASKS